MPRVRYEPTTSIFEKLKVVSTLDCAATVNGFSKNTLHYYPFIYAKFILVASFLSDFGIK
jgi:hypothetical protein